MKALYSTALSAWHLLLAHMAYKQALNSCKLLRCAEGPTFKINIIRMCSFHEGLPYWDLDCLC